MIRTQNIRMKWHVLVGIHKPLILYLIRNAKIESTFSAIQQILPGVQLKQASLSLCLGVCMLEEWLCKYHQSNAILCGM